MIQQHEINFKFIQSLGMSDCHHILKRDEAKGIQAETITPIGKYGDFGKPKTFYFIDNDEREFHTIDELIDSYNEKYKYEEDSPTKEVVFIKVIKDRKSKMNNNIETKIIQFNQK